MRLRTDELQRAATGLLLWARDARVELRGLDVRSASLEEAFLRIAREAEADGAPEGTSARRRRWHERGSASRAATTAGGRLRALARAELTLLGRNKGVLVHRAVRAAGAAVQRVRVREGHGPEGQSGLAIGRVIVPAAIGFSLLFAIYTALVNIFVVRREELVLKRLRTGELRDQEILAGAALPSVCIGVAQCVLVAGGRHGAARPRGAEGRRILPSWGSLLGVVLMVALAAVTAGFSRSAESAQVMSLPLMFVSMIASGISVPARGHSRTGSPRSRAAAAVAGDDAGAGRLDRGALGVRRAGGTADRAGLDRDRGVCCTAVVPVGAAAVRRGARRVLSRIRGWQRRVWGERSHLERVEIQHRVAVQCMHWFFYLSWLLLPLMDVERKPAAAGARRCARRWRAGPCALHTNRIDAAGHRPLSGPVRTAARGRCCRWCRSRCAVVGLILGLQLASGVKHGFIAFLTLFSVIPLSMAYSLLLPVRDFLRRHLWITAAITAGFAAVGVWDLSLLAIAGVSYAGPLLALASVRCGAWSLGVMLQAEQNRDAQARLAVAEERLRFGRDLHDVMGRNLAVIALKSELAVQLARRGRPEAVDQMIEVQRIAQESQREVREVVRGYREADLEAELAGAQGVLAAAGIDCRVSGPKRPGGCRPRCSRRSAGSCGRRRPMCCGTEMPGAATSH